MARTGTGLCEPRAQLDRKTEEVRVPLRTWFNLCPVQERAAAGDLKPPRTDPVDPRWTFQQQLSLSADDEIIMDFSDQSRSVEQYEHHTKFNPLHTFMLSPPLQYFAPELLQVEMATAMEKLGLLSDPTYAWDIFFNMMRNQLHHTLPSADLPKPFTESTRAILVDWLIQVHGVFNFSEETLYLAVHLLNRALRLIKVSISNLQLLGIVCLFLAAKKEECLLPEVSELCYLMANTYSRKQLLRMERRILCALRFELANTSPMHFLLLSAYIAGCSEKMICMARYLLELSLLEVQCVCVFPVQLAAAALRLARLLITEPHTPESDAAWYVASAISLGSEATLHNVMNIMAAAAAHAHNRETRATFVKFSTMETLCVSLHPALKGAPRLLGLQS